MKRLLYFCDKCNTHIEDTQAFESEKSYCHDAEHYCNDCLIDILNIMDIYTGLNPLRSL